MSGCASRRVTGTAPILCFAHDDTGLQGCLPLSEVSDSDYFGYFPGETYAGKTWLEENRIIADSSSTHDLLLEACPLPVHLRYLPPSKHWNGSSLSFDEFKYVFLPGTFSYSFDNYLGVFSGRSQKRFRREHEAWESLGISYRYNAVEDIQRVFSLNLDAFGDNSYFGDNRFLKSFEKLARLLLKRKWIRVTTVLVGGKIAAVDLGALYNGVYTVLAGGTDMSLPGIAKVINLHHLKWACEQGLKMVDFLCGDFGWKERFHLTSRPLYQIKEHAIGTENTFYSEDPLIDVA